MGYHDTYKNWQDNPEAYWLEQSKAIDWVQAPTQAMFDKGNDLYDWFADAKLKG
jgi:propionyl-CoA synthetase